MADFSEFDLFPNSGGSTQYVQGGAFGGLDFQPLGWGSPVGSQPASTLPSLPSTFAPSATSGGNVVASQGSAGGYGGTSAAPTLALPGSNGAASNAAPTNAASSAQPGAGSSIATGSIADYFARTVIVILGFIFIAVGLNMFRPGLIPNPVKMR
jgi:hypothetical protein